MIEYEYSNVIRNHYKIRTRLNEIWSRFGFYCYSPGLTTKTMTVPSITDAVIFAQHYVSCYRTIFLHGYCTSLETSVKWYNNTPKNVKDREMLERVQRRFTRMVPGLGDLEYGERLGVLGLMTLEERRTDLIWWRCTRFSRDCLPYQGKHLRIEWKWQDQRKFVEDCQESYPDGHQEVLLFSESHQPMECSWWEGGCSRNGWGLQEEITRGLR